MDKSAKRTQFPDLDKSQDRNVFVMMRYRENRDQFRHIEDLITKTLYRSGLYARYAKDKPRAQWIWENIKKYMDSCNFGIAVFDFLPLEKGEPRLNPNVCTELGYMLAKGKQCLLLKDKQLKLQTDLQGFIFNSFDGENLKTLKHELKKWAERQVKVLPLFRGFANLLPDSKIAQRLYRASHAKLSIGKYLAEEYFPKVLRPKSIILDSGTSAAAVAEALFLNREKYRKLEIHTNNLLASLLLCSSHQFNCKLVSGDVDENFAGVFGLTACEGIKSCDADATVLACTGFTAERGPYANSIENRKFKRSIIDKTAKTIIIATSERLGKALGYPVMQSAAAWEKILTNNVVMVVTCPRSESRDFKRVEKRLGRKLKVIEL